MHCHVRRFGVPKVVDAEEKRTEIAYAAWSVIAERGLPAATLRAVAAEAQMSMGAVQHYFDSKESMLLYACERMADLAGAQWSATADGGTARDRLEALALTSLTDHPLQRVGIAAWSAFVSRAAADGAMAEIVQRVWAGATEQTAGLLAEAAEEAGVEPVGSPEDVAASFQALLDGLGTRVLAGHLSFARARELARQFLDHQLGTAADDRRSRT
jgi:TetR/AcrR family transcriptional regulator, transcriptional repressor of bet genes